MSATEWLKYSVSVAAAGNYTLEAPVASSGNGGTFHLEVDGVDATGPRVVPNTGGWHAWTSLFIPNLSLTAGSHVLRLAIDSVRSTGYFGNVNYLRWVAQ